MMLKCPKCGAEMSDNAKFCSRCASPLETPAPPQEKPKSKRGCLIGFLVVIVLLGIFGGVMHNTDLSSLTTSVLASTTGMNAEQENAAIEIFTQCGIGEITSATAIQEGETQSSYYLDDDETEHYLGAKSRIVVWIDNDTKAVNAIYFHDHDIYVDGTVVDQVTNYYVSSSLRDTYKDLAEAAVNSVLNYPDTAKYSMSNWSYGVTDDGYHLVKSTVKAKNAFGMESESEFEIIFGDYGKVLSLVIDGVEYMQ